MKPKYFTKTFTRFFIGFICIVGVALAIMLIAADEAAAPSPVDNIAVPQ